MKFDTVVKVGGLLNEDKGKRRLPMFEPERIQMALQRTGPRCEHEPK